MRIVGYSKKAFDIGDLVDILEELYGRIYAVAVDQFFWRSVVKYQFVKNAIFNSAIDLDCSGTDLISFVSLTPMISKY